MKPSSPFSPSRSSLNNSVAPSGETAFHDGDTTPPRRHTPNNTAGAKSPRSVRFVAPVDSGNESGAGEEAERDGRLSGAISPSGSFIVTDHDGGDLLAHVANLPPPPRVDDLPPFRLTREDVEAAFEFLDVNGSGVLTMSNLKQRLSAFYPQLTSKEYKFLVEDPSGNNAAGSGGSGNNAGEASPQGFSSPFAAEGPKTDTAHPSASPPAQGSAKGVPNTSFGAHGGGAHTETPPSPAELAAAGHGAGAATAAGGGGGRAYGSRAGLDVDQLWDLIQSFQLLQSNLGGSDGAGGSPGAAAAPAVAAPGHRSGASSGGGGARRHVGPGGPNSPYDANVAASLLHGEAGFDAVGEAFRVYDPRNTHYVEKEVLSRIMAQIGFGELNEEDLTLLVGTADFDGDGRISLDDFRRLVNMKGRFKKA